jgi:hypothetical protein
MMTSNLSYSEGTVFAVPLRTGGFARGGVARASPNGSVLFGYFFGPKLSSINEIKTEAIRPEEAISQMIFGDLGLMNGEWIVVGLLSNWQRDRWGMPDFVRRDPLGNRAWRVRRLDSDPSKIESEEPVEFDANLPANLASGYGAVELKLTKLLS